MPDEPQERTMTEERAFIEDIDRFAASMEAEGWRFSDDPRVGVAERLAVFSTFLLWRQTVAMDDLAERADEGEDWKHDHD